VSQHRSQRLDVAMRRFVEQLDTKRELRPPTIVTTEDGNSFDALSLFDCGCTDSAINRAFVLKHHIPTKQLPFPQKSYNADGTPNKGGPISEYVSIRLDISGHAEMRHLLVLDISNNVYISVAAARLVISQLI
jgi:hypothetical protein